MMAEKLIPEIAEEGQPLPAEGPDPLDRISAPDEDADQFPQELILEPGGELDGAQRQNLYQKVISLNVPQKIRLAILGNREVRNLLIRDPNKVIPMAVLRNPKLTEKEILNYAQQKNIPEDVLLTITKHKSWIKNYPVKLALVHNPKTPLSLAIKFLDHLHDRDLQALSRNKNVSSILSQSAQRLLSKRRVK